MVEPFTIAANITAQLQPTAQDIALVYGAGPMGLTIIQALKGVYGVKQVIVVDRIAERLQMARENGADLTLDNTDQPLAEQLAQRQLAPTLVIDAACHPAILQEAILLASPAARIGILGFSGEASTLTQQSITSKEISIFLLPAEQRAFSAGHRLDGERPYSSGGVNHPLYAAGAGERGHGDFC